MSEKILLVDDDDQFRKAVKRSLELNDFEVIEASNGYEALDILAIESFDLVISDVKMPRLNGIELLHRIKRDRPDLSFILMTGFSEIIEIKEAYEIGADGFLAKPYCEDDLLFQINKIFCEEQQKKDKKSKYIGIAIEEFVAGAQIKYPIYIKLEDNSYVKIANIGEDLSTLQIKEFKEKGTLEFFLMSEDFIKYIDFNISIMGSIMRSERISACRKLKFLKIVTHQFINYIKCNGLDERVNSALEKLCDNFVRLVKTEKNLIYNLDEGFSNNLEQNDLASISVCLSFIFLKEFGWVKEDTYRDIFYAGLLQDLYFDVSPKEHPYIVVKELEENEFLNSHILEIISHHHEYIDGSGLPSGLKGSQINVLGNFLGMCYSLGSKLKLNGFQIQKAVNEIIVREKNLYKTEVLEVLNIKEVETVL